VTLIWNHPAWSTPDFVCPHCGEGWNEITHDEEYGYFMFEDGEEFLCVKCPKCDKEMTMTRTVHISVSYSNVRKRVIRNGL
jgi:uncharacterized Zn ribbon protein